MVAVAARLPRAPRWCLGVVDYRRRLVPLVDLAARLGLRAPRDEAQLVDGHIVLVEDRVGLVGYATDEVRELVDEEAEPVDATGGAAASARAAGLVRTSAGGMAPVLDPASLLTARGRRALTLALRDAASATRPGEVG
jgi:chemotaxis signal transduction protein